MNARNFFGLSLILVFAWLVINSCLEPFNPTLSGKAFDVLVVEGYINADTGITRIKLSKATPIDQGNIIYHERNAEVRIESDAHEIFLLTETDAGMYVTDTLHLPTDKQYRLSIKLSNGKTYTSDFQEVKVTPPIDSLHWEWRDQLFIYANAHDDQAETFYYTWSFQEDWQYRSPYWSPLLYSGDTLYPRFPSAQVKMLDCWGKSVSTEVVLASTRQFAHDAITYPITVIPAASEKTQTKYSIRVYQRTMTEEEYNYMVLVKKNSEQTGSFFDPMPSQLFGNIHRVDDPAEQVIGYVGSYTTQSFRLFILNSELPHIPFQDKCPPTDFEYLSENLAFFLSDTAVLLPYQMYYVEGDSTTIPHVLAYPAICMDCRLKYGETVHPDW
jgi:hypothetical protein